MNIKLMKLFFFILCPLAILASDSEVQQAVLPECTVTTLEYPQDIYPWYNLVSCLAKPLQKMIFNKIVFPFGEPEISIQLEKAREHAFAQSNNLRLIAFSLDNKCYILNLETRRITLLGHFSTYQDVRALLFTEDDQTLVLCSDKYIRVVNLSDNMNGSQAPLVLNNQDECADLPEYDQDNYNAQNRHTYNENSILLTIDSENKIIVTCSYGHIYRYDPDNHTTECLSIEPSNNPNFEELRKVNKETGRHFSPAKEVTFACRLDDSPTLLCGVHEKRDTRACIKEFNFETCQWRTVFENYFLPRCRLSKLNQNQTQLAISKEDDTAVICNISTKELRAALPYNSHWVVMQSPNLQFLATGCTAVPFSWECQSTKGLGLRHETLLFDAKTAALLASRVAPKSSFPEALFFNESSIIAFHKIISTESPSHTSIQIMKVRPLFSYFASFLRGECELNKFVFVKFLDDCFQEGLILHSSGLRFKESSLVRALTKDKDGLTRSVTVLVRKKDEKTVLRSATLIKQRGEIQNYAALCQDSPNATSHTLSEASKHRLAVIWQTFTAEEQTLLQKFYSVFL